LTLTLTFAQLSLSLWTLPVTHERETTYSGRDHLDSPFCRPLYTNKGFASALRFVSIQRRPALSCVFDLILTTTTVARQMAGLATLSCQFINCSRKLPAVSTLKELPVTDSACNVNALYSF